MAKKTKAQRALAAILVRDRQRLAHQQEQQRILHRKMRRAKRRSERQEEEKNPSPPEAETTRLSAKGFSIINAIGKMQ